MAAASARTHAIWFLSHIAAAHTRANVFFKIDFPFSYILFFVFVFSWIELSFERRTRRKKRFLFARPPSDGSNFSSRRGAFLFTAGSVCVYLCSSKLIIIIDEFRTRAKHLFTHRRVMLLFSVYFFVLLFLDECHRRLADWWFRSNSLSAISMERNFFSSFYSQYDDGDWSEESTGAGCFERWSTGFRWKAWKKWR